MGACARSAACQQTQSRRSRTDSWPRSGLRATSTTTDYAKDAVAGEPLFLLGIEWRVSYKRDSISTFVDRLVKHQDEHQDLLIGLLVDVSQMDSFPGLDRVEDASVKIAAAREAVARLRAVVQPYEEAPMGTSG